MRAELSHVVTPVILCGGLGTRLQTVLPDTPKALAPISGKPFLELLLRRFESAGFRSTILATGHLSEKIESQFGEQFQSMKIRYSKESSPLGTGGAVRFALRSIETDTLLVLNGDSYCDVDYQELLATHLRTGADGTLTVVSVHDASRFGTIEIAADGRVQAFREKRPGAGWINAGVYLFNRELCETISPGAPCSLEHDCFPTWVKTNALFSYPTQSNIFIDIGTPSSLEEAGRILG